MASAFSNHSVSLTPIPATTRTPSRTRIIVTPAVCICQNPKYVRFGTRFSEFSFRPTARRSFRASSKVAESDPKTIEGEEDNHIYEHVSEDKTENLLTMKSLIQAYKEAILNEDEKVVSNVEEAICSIEREKSDLFSTLEEINADIASTKERFLHLNANFVNLRKHIEKEHLKFTSDVQGEVIKSLLPMVDSFERTKQQLKPETEKEKKIDTSYQGIYKQFVETLRASHVAVIETVGKKFDPLAHEAVARVESEQFREGIVIQEVRRGFVLGDRILRPARVKISRGLGAKSAPSSMENSVGEPAAVSRPDEGPASATDSS